MNNLPLEKQDIGTFLKNAMVPSKTNIQHNYYVSIMSNLGLLLVVFMLTAFFLYVAYLPISEIYDGFEEYAYMGVFVVIAGLVAFLCYIPVMLMNIVVLYSMSNKFSDTARSFTKVVSDHTTILISTFLLYSIGLYFASFMETLEPYAPVAGTLIIGLSIVIYVRHSISLATYYVEGRGKTMVAVYRTVLIAIAILTPFFFNYMSEGFVIARPLGYILRMLQGS